MRRSGSTQGSAPRDCPPTRPQSPADLPRLRRLPCFALPVGVAVRDQEGGTGMRSIAHAHRLSSRAASSRYTVDALVVGNPVPIGIPALFLADQLSRGRSGEQILSGKRGLIAEYAGAEGYAYAWGHLIEVRLGRSVLWRIVPVALWERLSDVRAESPLLIEELLTLVQPGI